MAGIRAYLRLDPMIRRKKGARYPDGAYAAYIDMLCLAEEQPRRGRFESLRILQFMLAKRGRWARFFVDHGDVVAAEHHQCKDCPPDKPLPGELYVEGWDAWQEGDWKVAERVSRIRTKHQQGLLGLQPVTAHVTPGVTVGGVSPVTPGVTDPSVKPRARGGGGSGSISGGGEPLLNGSPSGSLSPDQRRVNLTASAAAAQALLDDPDSTDKAKEIAAKAIDKANAGLAQLNEPEPDDVDFSEPGRDNGDVTPEVPSGG